MSRARDLANGITTLAPLASPTFTGDAVFDNDTLKVDSSNDRVGIGTASPEAFSSLHVVSSGYQPLIVNTDHAGGGGLTVRHSNTQKMYVGSGGSTHLTGSSTDDALIRATGNFQIATGGNTERLKIDSSGSITTPNSQFNGTIGSSATNNSSFIGFSAHLLSNITADSTTFTWHSYERIIQGCTESSGTITLPTAGQYFYSLVCMGQSSATGGDWFSARVYVGGAQIGTCALEAINETSQTYHQISHSAVVSVDANDTCYVNSNFNGTNTIFGGTQYTRFSIFRVGA